MVSGALNNPISGLTGLTESADELRHQFVGQLLGITGDTRLLWVPFDGDTTTATTTDLNERTITWDATVAARLSALGLGYSQSFDGNNQNGTVPDADNLSFGDGSNDSAFSIIVLANVTDSAAARTFVAKDASSNREWAFFVASDDILEVNLWDDSAAVRARRRSSSAITQGSMQLFGFSYDATGGGTAANGITLYVNGLLRASGATNSGSYTAMENKAADVEIGSNFGGNGDFLGDQALIAVVGKELSASEHWALKQLVNGFFGLSL